MKELYADLTGDPSYMDLPIEHVSSQAFYGEGYEDCDRRVPDVSKAERLLDWRAKTSLRDTLRQTLTWFRDHYANPG